jgi:hypothetical protein
MAKRGQGLMRIQSRITLSQSSTERKRDSGRRAASHFVRSVGSPSDNKPISLSRGAAHDRPQAAFARLLGISRKTQFRTKSHPSIGIKPRIDPGFRAVEKVSAETAVISNSSIERIDLDNHSDCERNRWRTFWELIVQHLNDL